MGNKFVQLSQEDVPALPSGYHIMLNVEERIVTLIYQGRVCAQSRFSRSAFRLLCLLLRSPEGANYAELLACLRCSESTFRSLLAAPSHEQALATLGSQVERWNKHLQRLARLSRTELEKELKMVRRAAKERCGANTILKKNGFTFSVQALYRKGYLLVRTHEHTS